MKTRTLLLINQSINQSINIFMSVHSKVSDIKHNNKTFINTIIVLAHAGLNVLGTTTDSTLYTHKYTPTFFFLPSNEILPPVRLLRLPMAMLQMRATCFFSCLQSQPFSCQLDLLRPFVYASTKFQVAANKWVGCGIP